MVIEPEEIIIVAILSASLAGILSGFFLGVAKEAGLASFSLHMLAFVSNGAVILTVGSVFDWPDKMYQGYSTVASSLVQMSLAFALFLHIVCLAVGYWIGKESFRKGNVRQVLFEYCFSIYSYIRRELTELRDVLLRLSR